MLFLQQVQHFKCTSTVSDSGNLEIRLEGVLFISKQSFKELRERAQSASNSVLGQGDTRSMSPTLRSALILFSAERSCQRGSQTLGPQTQQHRARRGEKKDTRDECVYPCDDKGERIEQDGAEEAC